MNQKKIFANIGMAYFLLAILTIALQLLIPLIFNRAGVYPSGGWVILISLAPLYLVAMPVCAKYMRKIPKRQLFEHPIGFGRWFMFLLMCLFVMIAGNIIGNIVCLVLTHLTGIDMTAFDLQEILLNGGLPVTFLFTVILAPILEELIFRKVLIDRAIVFGDRTAILLSGFLFGVFHGNFHQLFYAFGLGCMLAYLYIRTGKLRYPVSIHMAINLIGGFLPLILMKNLNFDFLGAGEGAFSEIYSYLFGHLGILLAYSFYVLLLIAGVISGLVILILSVKKAVLRRGEYSMPAKETLRMAFANPGMILYCASCALLFVLDMLQT